MTEQEAADKLCALLNEIEQAGHVVECDSRPTAMWVGNIELSGPQFDDGVWEVRES